MTELNEQQCKKLRDALFFGNTCVAGAGHVRFRLPEGGFPVELMLMKGTISGGLPATGVARRSCVPGSEAQLVTGKGYTFGLSLDLVREFFDAAQQLVNEGYVVDFSYQKEIIYDQYGTGNFGWGRRRCKGQGLNWTLNEMLGLTPPPLELVP
ncbi:MAG: hypothetical protein AB7G06_06610 [Bdellovibrionales bacterium]